MCKFPETPYVTADTDSSFIAPLFVITVIFNFLASLVVTGDYCK